MEFVQFQAVRLATSTDIARVDGQGHARVSCRRRTGRCDGGRVAGREEEAGVPRLHIRLAQYLLPDVAQQRVPG